MKENDKNERDGFILVAVIKYYSPFKANLGCSASRGEALLNE
jgi:hypothetical protein